ncbi:hypothetical protein D3C76_1656670 [compost metagenome]
MIDEISSLTFKSLLTVISESMSSSSLMVITSEESRLDLVTLIRLDLSENKGSSLLCTYKKESKYSIP